MISMQARKVIWRGALLATCVVMVGCIGKGSPPVTYYSLLTMRQMQIDVSPRVSHPDLRIGIGPVTLPDTLQRAQFAVRDARNVYRFDEYHRWAGSLEKDFASVLGDNLGELLGTQGIALFPWMYHFRPTHRVIVNITQFDGNLSGDAVLSARWTIADKGGAVVLDSGRSVFRQPVEGGDYAGLVKTESLLLADLSKQIAEVIERLPAPN